MIVLNKRVIGVSKPNWLDNSYPMGHDLAMMLEEQKVIGRIVMKITIEAQKKTQIEYVIIPGRWIDRLYDNGMLRRGTL